MRRSSHSALIIVMACGAAAPGAASALTDPSPAHLPGWRGFNLPDMMSAEWAQGPFQEEDFRLTAKLGFGFVRLPLDYRLWTVGGDWERIDEHAFAPIDQAVRWGIRCGIHVCVNPPAEPRNLFADALSYGREPRLELLPLRVAQATRGYHPMSLTHYRADWVEGSDAWPVPAWPPLPVSAHLYGPGQPELASALVVEGPFARLRVRADGKVILDRAFRPGPGKGEWMTFTEMGFLAPGAAREKVLAPGDTEWGTRQGMIRVDLASDTAPFTPAGAGPGAGAESGAQAPWQSAIKPFQELERRGAGIMVGDFGVLDSNRADVAYKPWEGHLLDREMLELLQRF
jgi:hypothetical protein